MLTLIIFLILLLENVLSQNTLLQHKSLELNKAETGSILEKNGMSYYKLVVPSNVVANTTNLAIRVKENDAADTNGDDFSDPDVYISKTNQFPNNPENCTWFSERYGEDLVSIPKYSVQGGEVFYIGVYCERKCKYEIVARLETEYELQEGFLVKSNIVKEDSISFRFKAKSDYSEMEIIAYSDRMGYFRIYVGKDQMPTNQNTLLAIPSWAGGYSVNINKGSKDYCSGCYYYIVLEAPVYDTQVYLFVKYEDTVTQVRSTEPVFSTLRPFRTHCYKYRIDAAHKNENLIIQVSLFMGSASLLVQPWSLPSENADEFSILSERIIKYSPQERKDGNNTETGDFFFCIKANEFTSYILKAVFESEIEDTQKFNVLYRGREIDGYVPANNATRYRILDFEAQSNITVSLYVKSGDPKLYGYICENIQFCKFSKPRVEAELLKNKMILAKEFSIGYTLEIPNSINTCHQKYAKNDTIENISQNLRCAVLAVIVCQGNEDCEYSIRSTRNDFTIQLQPRKPHYQIIPNNEADFYSIKIEDDTISTLNIVLNSITGDADMKVWYTDLSSKTPSQKLIGVSENEPYIPDVVRIKNDTLGRSNIVGLYNVTVLGSSFGSYSIYYYTIRKSEHINISADLQTGYIIRDVFKKETKYKVYTYNPRMRDPLDIRIAITPEVSQYSIYVFFDVSQLKYEEKNSWDPITGYIWKSTRENELVIKKSHPQFKKDEIYYIVIAKVSDWSEVTQSNATPSFYIGVTNEFYPFLLYEGIPQLITLDSYFKSQTYWYTHPNISDPFSLSVNLYYGRVSVYADFQEIRDLNSTNLAIKSENVETSYMTISPEVMKKNCKQNNCGIFIRVDRSSELSAQYLLVAKSHPNKPESLSAGVLRYDTISPGEVRKYSILLEKKANSVIFVSCTSGFVEVYVNVNNAIQNSKKANYPSKEKFDYIANDTIFGKVLNLDNKVFNNCDPCQILVSVYGQDLGFANSAISFSIAHYEKARRLNQNQPLKGHIKQGEFQFYRVYFGNPKSIYLSLSNMDGDVDVYMNYGKNLPTFDNTTWWSNTLTNEFIEVDREDPFFLSNHISDISGDYTIMLYGFSNSTYTLYLTEHDKKFLTVDDSPASCKAKAKESCLFKYDIFQWGILSKTIDEYYDYLITTDFLFGSGVIYVRLFSGEDSDIMNDFPNSQKNDFNTVKSNSRNLLKFRYYTNSSKIVNTSVLLISVQCKEDCFFDLNVMQWFDSDLQYLSLYRENIFYIYASQEKSVLLYYNYKPKDLVFNFYTYEGRGSVTVYTKETNWESAEQQNNRTEIDKFQIDSETRMQSYTNTISSTKYNIMNRSIYFDIKPEKDMGFYALLTYNQDFNKLKLGKANQVTLNTGSPAFYGFFDMLDEFEYVILSVSSENPDSIVYVHIKYVYVDKSDIKNSGHHNYTFPDNGNSDMTGNTDQLLHSTSLKINNPKFYNSDKKDKRFIRVLISIVMADYSYRNNKNTDTLVSLILSPSTKGMSKTEVAQNSFIFAQFKGLKSDVKIFDLKKKSPEDNLLIIEMSSCSGDFNYGLSDKMNFASDDIQNIEKYEDISGGRKFVKVKLDKIESDSFFLTLSAKESGGKECFYFSNAYYCEDVTVAMFYYFTTTEDKYKRSFSNGKGSLEIRDVNDDNFILRWRKVMTQDKDNKLVQAKANYTLFISDNVFDFNHMESVCYLSKMKQNFTDYQIKSEFDWTEAYVKGLQTNKRYFVNVLARNIEDNDILAFQPVEVILKKTSVSPLVIVLPIVLVIVLIILVVYFYKKYKVTKQILNYEVNDVRNMSSVPKSLAELRDLAVKSERQKYANLAEDNTI